MSKKILLSVAFCGLAFIPARANAQCWANCEKAQIESNQKAADQYNLCVLNPNKTENQCSSDFKSQVNRTQITFNKCSDVCHN